MRSDPIVGAWDADVERDGVPIDAADESQFASRRLATVDHAAETVAIAVGEHRVDNLDVRLVRVLDDVRRGGAAAEGPVVALNFQLERYLALAVFAGGDSTDG
jgi:hypothetical protein